MRSGQRGTGVYLAVLPLSRKTKVKVKTRNPETRRERRKKSEGTEEFLMGFGQIEKGRDLRRHRPDDIIFLRIPPFPPLFPRFLRVSGFLVLILDRATTLS